MNITLIGYGKMGKTIERLAQERGDSVVHIMDIDENPLERGFSGGWVKESDVCIDFSVAEAVPINIANAIQAGLSIVVGTTGWFSQVDQIRNLVERQGGSCLYASNFSVGVQVFFHLARQAARRLRRFQDYDPFILEIHHVQKADAPSGTALTLQEILEESYQREISTSSMRAGFFPGIHTVGFDSPVDTLELTHTARSREGFARGALLAARWLCGRKGFYEFDQVISGEES